MLPLILTAALAAGAWAMDNSVRVDNAAPAGVPILVKTELPPGFNPDSVRVRERASGKLLPCRTEWERPAARIYFQSTGASAYEIRYSDGPAERLVAPAMIGAGDRVGYGRPARGRLSVGLWAYPVALDYDSDRRTDLIVACTDRPFNGTYLFRNRRSNREPLFDRPLWLGPGKKDLVLADFNGDGLADLVTSGGYFSDVRRNGMSQFVTVVLPRSYHVGRDDLWYPIDWDNDGRIDLLTGVSDWRDYGWDDAFSSDGQWMRPLIHGYVYFHRNTGTNQNPVYNDPVPVEAGGRRIDLRGSPAPNPVDWFGRGKLDLIGGDFVDTITLFENIGRRDKPELAMGRRLEAAGRPIRMDLCMIQPRVVDWFGDGRWSLIVGEEDGRVAFFENTAPRGVAPQLEAARYFEQVDPDLKSGALSRPVPVDWDGDGDLDLIAGNSAGYVQYFENTGTKTAPVFVDHGYLTAGGATLRIMAGPNGSIQGPVEEKWGYTNPWVADWDLDGKLDLLLNSIWGEVLWYRNVGTRRAPVLAAAARVEVEWPGPPPAPAWNWWKPRGRQLVTQWRTTPRVVDWNRDGLPDLVMLDHEGFLALYERYRERGELRLKPPARIFLDEKGEPLRLAAKRAGGSGRRKVDLVDWDGDGDLDLITDADAAAWYENTGRQAKPVFTSRGVLTDRKLSGHNPTPAAADWNGDGRLDLLVGAEDGHFYFFDRRYLNR